MHFINRAPLVDVGWILMGVAAAIGTAMVVVGMIEELPGIIRTTFSQFKRR